MNHELIAMGERARRAAAKLNILGQNEKNRGLSAVADCLKKNKETLLRANEKDIIEARKQGMKEAMIDRLRLTEERIDGIAEGLMQVILLNDPVGEILSMEKRPNGLMIGQRRVPIGVVGIIYESRPNVTADAFGLCFKTGNAVILRGGSDAINSNMEIVRLIREGLLSEGLPEDSISLITDTSRETAAEFMKLNKYVDVLIPRGGAGLIQAAVQQSTIPVIETGTGNCHIYVDQYADYDKALSILINAKTQRYGVCNACESLVVHEAVASSFLPLAYEALRSAGVAVRGDEKSRAVCPEMEHAAEADFGTEYLDAIISVKVVSDLTEAIEHINYYNTKHSDAIITENYDHAMRFLNEIDAACVYVNASTRFTDGFEFGFGAEIGISTQKLHARGPMGLKALTTTKYIILGNGQIRK
ncbi:glutamate-5-semialdehyde dehydrogenase [Anaerolentibacter hominis]|uniref:glutamate-5-semialdehyde dehydrogenase n=1 Tax=Anaerolentibacter hominis TaxID=3079009 RepID=UPI0031B7EDB7